MSNLWKFSTILSALALLVLGISFPMLGEANAQNEAHPFSITSNLEGKNFTITGTAIGNSTAVPKSFQINPNQSIDIQVDGKGTIQLTLPKALINGITVVTAENVQLYHKEISNDSTSTTIQVSIPNDVNSIKIAGSRVIPEFPILLTTTVSALGVVVAILGARFSKQESW